MGLTEAFLPPESPGDLQASFAPHYAYLFENCKSLWMYWNSCFCTL